MNKYERHREICDRLNEIYKENEIFDENFIYNIAYGDSFGRTFADLGIMSAVTRMYDKFHRITALAQGARNDVKDETVEDTLMDLANYAIMTLIEIEIEQNGICRLV